MAMNINSYKHFGKTHKNRIILLKKLVYILKML